MLFSTPFIIIPLVVYLWKSPKLFLELNEGINKLAFSSSRKNKTREIGLTGMTSYY